jgi:hypothetical protein
MKIFKYIPLLVLAIVLLGCSFTVNVPTVDTSTTSEFDINQPLPAGSTNAEVDLEMGGGKLNISEGSSQFVEGSVLYNVPDWKPTLSVNGNTILISQNHTSNVGIPSGKIKNNWNLKLGASPLSLRVSAGAYEGTLDLSGLSLTDLEISDGASQAVVRFDTKNPVEMQRLTYKTGASDVKLLGLANANTSEITFDSGAGSYTLDFSGELSRDMNVKISSGLSQVKVIVPDKTHAIVNLTGGISNIDLDGTWITNGTQYEAQGSGPLITININMAVGNLVLVNQ